MQTSMTPFPFPKRRIAFEVPQVDWRTIVSGGDDPPNKWAWIGVSLVVAVLLLFASAANFGPAIWFKWLAWVPAIIFGVARANWMARAIYKENEPIVRLFCGVLGAGILWLVLVYAIGFGMTCIAGHSSISQPEMFIVHYSYGHRHSTHYCDFYLDAMDNTYYEESICVSEDYVERHAFSLMEGTQVQLQLLVRKSVFGICILEFKPLDIWDFDSRGAWRKRHLANAYTGNPATTPSGK